MYICVYTGIHVLMAVCINKHIHTVQMAEDLPLQHVNTQEQFQVCYNENTILKSLVKGLVKV